MLVKQQNVKNNLKTVEKCEKCTKFVWKNKHAKVFSRDLQSEANNIFEAVNSATCKKQIDDVVQQLTVFLYKKSLTQFVKTTFVEITVVIMLEKKIINIRYFPSGCVKPAKNLVIILILHWAGIIVPNKLMVSLEKIW